MRINNNLMAMNTHRQLGLNSTAGAKSIEKLSSGYRINRAGDDAAGLAISEKMRAQIRGLNQASRNSQDGISLIQTAEGALSETQSILQRMRELAVQSASDTNVTVDRGQIQKEMNQLTSEINRIGNTTEFNTQKLINGERSATYVSATAAAYTAASGLGLAVTQTGTTATYTSGTYTLKIDKVSDVTAATTSGVIAVGVTNADNMVFENNNIQIDYTAGVENALKTAQAAACGNSAGATLQVTYCAGGLMQVTISAGANGYLGSVVKEISADSSGDYTFSDYGISFKITDIGTASAGSTFTYVVSANGTTTAAGTLNTLWTSTAGTASTTGVLSATTTAGAEAGTWTGTVSANGTAITYQFVGVDGTTHCAVELLTAATTATNFCANGVEFKFSAAVGISAMAGSTFSYAVTASYKFDATLVASSGTTVSTATLLENYSGAGSATFTAGFTGLTITAAAVSAVTTGTMNFTVDAPHTDTITDGSVNFQIGANQGQALNVEISDMRAKALNVSRTATGSFTYTRANGDSFTADLIATSGVTDGTNATNVEYALDVSTFSKATKAITVINDAIESVSSERAKLGANQNRLEYTIRNLDTSAENLQASESRIRDVDMAKEMMNFTKNNILQQAAQAMLAQANQAPQGVLQLLR